MISNGVRRGTRATQQLRRILPWERVRMGTRMTSDGQRLGTGGGPSDAYLCNANFDT